MSATSAQVRAHPGDSASWRGPQVCSVAGITYRQLDYWARIGVLRPSLAEARGSGTQRRYSTADVAAAALLAHLSRFGCRLSAVSSVIESLQRTPLGVWPDWVVVTHDGLLIELVDVLTAESGDMTVCWLVNLRRVVVDVTERAELLLD